MANFQPKDFRQSFTISDRLKRHSAGQFVKRGTAVPNCLRKHHRRTKGYLFFVKEYLCRQSWHFSPVELRYCTVYHLLWFQSINSPVRRKAKFLGQSPWSWSNALGSGDVRPGRRGVASLPLRRGRTGRFGLTLFIGIVFSPMSWINYTFHTL